MAQQWEQVGEGDNRQWKLTITTVGRSPQVYYGKSKAQIAEQLANAQEHATEAIDQLKQGNRPAPAPRKATPQPLQPGERMQVASDITNPAKVETAVTRVIESVTGKPISELAAGNAEQNAANAATRFVQGTPDWYPTEHNKQTLVAYMQTHSMDNTKVEDFSRAFQNLMAAGLLQTRPEQPKTVEAEPERIAPRTQTPARVSTGIRANDVSGTTAPPSRRLKYTREEIDKMGKEKYKHLLMTDPELTRCVEYYNRPVAV